MNIKVQCCGIVLLVLLAVLYSRGKKPKLLSNRVFQGCFYVSLLCLEMDIMSIFAIVYSDELPAIVPVLVCKTYLALLVLVALLAVVYVTTSVSFHLPGYKTVITASIVYTAVVVILIYALPISIVHVAEQNLAWTEGPSTQVTFFAVAVFVVVNLVMIFLHKKHLFNRQRQTVLIWMLLWIVAAVLQAIFQQLLIVGFACALGVTLVFIQFENPEMNLDRTTGLFNYTAYTRFCQQLYSTQADFYVIAMVFENPTWKIYDMFQELQDATVFKVTENEILTIFSDKERAQSAWDSFWERMREDGVDVTQGYPSVFHVANPRCVDSPRELQELLRFVRAWNKDAKPGGTYYIEESDVAQMRSEQKMTQQLLEALKEDRIIVYYQPIYSVKEQRFISAEALVRMTDREGNLLPLGSAVYFAENNGLIIEIGKRVFEKACRFYQQHRLQDYGLQYIEVNLSLVQCANDRLADDFIRIMDQIKLDPKRINLEITESASLREKQTLMANMERLIDYGISFSLDDFGTGNSNLNYIVDMPVEIVKFDKDMVQAYFESGKAKYVMDAAMHMIRGMDLKIVAEGIETEEQFQKMVDMEIDFIQGYYFSRPLSEENFLSFLHEKNVVTSMDDVFEMEEWEKELLDE